MNSTKLIIYTDGGARGNPGPAGIGVVIYNHQKEILGQYKKFLGVATNNQAEYQAVVLALEKAQELGGEEIDFFLDSELVVGQLSQTMKVKNKELAKIFVKIWNLALGFKRIKYHHVPREENKLADKLVNQAIDQKQE
ncbi:MAG: ribonuclease HI family protein [Patescibacteria group bacterium]